MESLLQIFSENKPEFFASVVFYLLIFGGENLLYRLSSRFLGGVEWRKVLLNTLHRPTQLSILVAASVKLLRGMGAAQMVSDYNVVEWSLGFFLFWITLRGFDGLHASIFAPILKKAGLDDTSRKMALRLIQLFCVIGCGLVMLDFWDLSIPRAIKIFGAAGLGFGVLAKNFLVDFVSGFFLLVDKPFSVGDLVFLPKPHEVKGTVIAIGPRLVRFQLANNEIVAIPNSAVLSATIQTVVPKA
jgi:small-conductance mechanosensitive channel